MMENKFDMNDMLAQFAQIRKMGGAGAMLSMLPGMSGIDASQIDEKAFDRIEAMIYSMTKAEREDPSIINPCLLYTSRIWHWPIFAPGPPPTPSSPASPARIRRSSEMCIRDSYCTEVVEVTTAENFN